MTFKFNTGHEQSNLCFIVGGQKIIEICANGDFFIKGKLVTNDLELLEGFRNFLKLSDNIK